MSCRSCIRLEASVETANARAEGYFEALRQIRAEADAGKDASNPQTADAALLIIYAITDRIVDND